jgi:hypothetical protein
MTDENPSWFIDEGVPGVGERPAWLGEKFKTAADLGRSYSELEKKFFTDPEEYDFHKSKFLDADYAPFQDLLALAKNNRVPKEVMDKMVDSFDKYMDEFSIDPEEETKKLGDNAKERLVTLDNWAKANLSKESYEALAGIRSADGIKALEELRGKMMSGNPVVPNGNDGGTSSSATLDDLRSELSANLEKYKTDPHYRKDLQSRLEVASRNSGVLDKNGP